MKLNLVLFDLDVQIGHLAINFKNSAVINLNVEKAIKVKEFFRKNKLRCLPSSISSHSEFPHEFLATILAFLKEKTVIFIGTYGLSYESIEEIYRELNELHKDQEKIIFICHPRKLKSGQIEILNINNLNEIDGGLDLLKK
ncbi:hypothetical protein IUY40_00815 [Flavobacterium sp. ALJ2]|uniref:hypothetical protein n=1 Tax=Flavobacterium sp. ALJ2 TaxID=2786960 RepID=UPI00189D1A0B|nr:hypothetical protein [Flavobacterium sp. ALJ2]MBF7090083.1 hypothetical protein [Flavobacterium sp. ALJ2]